jgi:hypothetical protein
VPILLDTYRRQHLDNPAELSDSNLILSEVISNKPAPSFIDSNIVKVDDDTWIYGWINSDADFIQVRIKYGNDFSTPFAVNVSPFQTTMFVGEDLVDSSVLFFCGKIDGNYAGTVELQTCERIFWNQVPSWVTSSTRNIDSQNVIISQDYQITSDSTFTIDSQLLKKCVKSDNTKLAVIFHVFYPNLMEQYLERIRQIPENFDLYITTPFDENVFLIDKLSQYHQSTKVLRFANKGRDILPFIYTAEALYTVGYEYALKIHTKKSPHKNVNLAKSWINKLFDTILSADKYPFILDTLRNKNAKIIGASDLFIPLLIKYSTNIRFLRKIAKAMQPQFDVVDKIERCPHEQKFFAGSMFWCKLEALKPIIDLHFNDDLFAEELGQTDGELIHAIERFFGTLIDNNPIQIKY